MGTDKTKQFKRQNEYIKNNYDRISVTLPAGTKQKIIGLGLSVNKYINDLVLSDLEKRDTKTD